MRIAIATDSFLPYISGVTTYTTELARQLSKNGHEVLLIVPDYPNENVTPTGLEEIKIVRLRSIPTIFPNLRINTPNTVKVIRAIRKFEPEIIEIETPLFLGIDTLIASKVLGIPTVSTFHTLTTSKEYLQLIFKSKVKNFVRASWAFHKRFYNASDAVFVFTETVQKLLIRKGFAKNKIHRITTFFDFYNAKILKGRKRHILKKRYGLKKRVAVYVGRISPEKNLKTLINIWRKVINNYPNSTLLIIGSGAYEKELNNQIKKLKLEDKVVLTGKIEHVELMTSGLLSTCDIFVTASRSETFGLTGIEAMAHKLPVVLFKSQGLAEILGSAGIVCRPNHSKEFENAILSLFQDENLRLTKGRAAREFAREFSSEVNVPKITIIYKSIIQNYKPKRTSLKYLKNTKAKLSLERYKKYFSI